MFASLCLAVSIVFPAKQAVLPHSLDTCYMIGSVSRGVTNLVVQGKPVEIYKTGGWVTMLDLKEGTNVIDLVENRTKVTRHPVIVAKAPPRVTTPAKDKPVKLAPEKWEKLAYASDYPIKPPHAKLNREITICLDPGHGGKDTGTLSPHGFPEKDANLRVAREVKTALEAKGFKVIMTRDADVAIDLHERPRTAHKIKADAFVSIHHNAPPYKADPRKTRYHTVYAWNAIGESLAEKINARMGDALAGDIPNKGVLHANYAVTRSPEIPSCLIEVDFITTPEGEEAAWNVARRRKIGESIAQGISDWCHPMPYFLDLWQHPWAVARWHKVAPFSPEHYAAMEPLWRMLGEAGQSVLTTTLLDLPWNHQCYDGYYTMIARTKKADGSWVFDYSVFDAYVTFGRKCGIGPDIACYSLCPWGFVVRWKNEQGEECQMKALPGTPEFEDYWGDFLVDFAKHLKAKGWFEDTYIAMDERSPEDVRKIAEFVQRKAPGLKIAMAGDRSPAAFKGIQIDNYSQAIQHVTPTFLEEVKLRRAEGFKTSVYVCCYPAHPNTFMSSPLSEAYFLGVYPVLAGFDGFLRWAANSWPEDPYKDASYGNWPAGDTFLIYPNGEPSARFVALCEGIKAAKALRELYYQGRITQEIKALNEKYPLEKALKGELDYDAFRADVEKLITHE